MAISNEYELWLAIRFVAGMISAWTFIFAAQWGMTRLSERNAEMLGGIIFSGSGVGILLTGAVGHFLSRDVSPSVAWLAYSALAALISTCVWTIFRKDV